MKEIVLLIAAITWLIHRATTLIRVPAPVLIHILGIDLPETPQVSVDNVTDQTISIHWTKASKSGSMVVKYVVEVNNVKVGETDRAGSNVTLKNLTPNKRYEIKVLAVNASNYRSHASSILVHTKISSDEQLPPTINPLVGITFQSGLKRNRISSRAALAFSSANGSSASYASASASSASVNGSPSNIKAISSLSTNGSKPDDPSSSQDPTTDKYYTIDNLTREVEGIQEEITELLSQAAAAEDEFVSAESVLISELEALKNRKRMDDQQRAGIRSEAKNLEESKRSLETQRSKLERRCHSLEADLEKRRTRQETWHQEMAEARFKIGQLEQSIDHLNDESSRDVDNVKGMLEACQHDILNLEEHIKNMISTVKKAENTKQATSKVLDEFRRLVDPVTLLPVDEKTNLTKLTLLENVDDYFAEWMACELKIDQALEDEWKHIQKDLEVRYLKVHDQYEKARIESNNAKKLQTAPKTPTSIMNQTPSFLATGYHGPPNMGSGVGSSSASSFIQSTGSAIPLNSGAASTSTGSFLGIPSSNVSATRSISGINASSSSPISRGGVTFNGDAYDESDDDSIPPANSLLPSNLFGKEDLTESFATFFKNEGPNDNEPSLAPVTTGRSLLFSDAASVYSNNSLRVLSPKQSLLFGRSNMDDNNNNAGLPSPPSVTLFPGSPVQPVMHVDESVSPDAKKKDKALNRKFSTRFFFGRNAPRESSLSNSVDLMSDENDVDGSFLTSTTTGNSSVAIGSNGYTMDDILMRPRASSFSSALSSKTPSINPNDAFFNTWRDTTANNPWAAANDWQSNDKEDDEQPSKDKVKTPKKQKKQKANNAGTDSVPQFLYSPTKIGKSGFKGFAGLFERSPGVVPPTDTNADSQAAPMLGEKNSKFISSLFRKSEVDDETTSDMPVPLELVESGSSSASHPLQKHLSSELSSSLLNSGSSVVSSNEYASPPGAVLPSSVASKESANFLQKSMRRSFVSRRSTSTASSNKFVRKLSIFGKKNDPRDDEILFEGGADGYPEVDGEGDIVESVDDLDDLDGENSANELLELSVENRREPE